VGGAAEERRAIARLDALASWTESLRDTIAGAVGLEQAIPAADVDDLLIAPPTVEQFDALTVTREGDRL